MISYLIIFMSQKKKGSYASVSSKLAELHIQEQPLQKQKGLLQHTKKKLIITR